MQLRELREYCKRSGWAVAAEFVDTGWSGAKTSRPQFDLLLDAARLKKFDAILVWKLDRWGRSLAHLVASIEELAFLGIRFVAVTQAIDTDAKNPMAKLLFHVMAAFAEFERELIRERVKAGLEKARAEGRELGRRRVVVSRDRVLKLVKAGKPIRFIAKKLHLSHGTAQRIVAAVRPEALG